MNIIIAAFLTIIISSNIIAQERKMELNLMPMPQQIDTNNEIFRIDKNIAIQFNFSGKRIVKAANRFLIRLSRRTGTSPRTWPAATPTTRSSVRSTRPTPSGRPSRTSRLRRYPPAPCSSSSDTEPTGASNPGSQWTPQRRLAYPAGGVFFNERGSL